MIKLWNTICTRLYLAITISLLAFFFLGVSQTHAQSAEIQIMITRMEAIMTQMQLLQKEFLALAQKVQGTAAPTPTVLGASASTVFTESLTYGETNDDIKRIQTLLATDPEIYSYGVASGFFGPKTQEAIRNLQSRFNLDPIGIIGPATTALLEGYMRVYPDENYPDGVLSTKPKVLGVSISKPVVSTQTPTPAPTPAPKASNPASSIVAEFDDDETWIAIRYNDGTQTQRIVADSEDEDDVVDYIVKKTKLSEAQVLDLIEYEGRKSNRRSNNSDYDEDDAEDALDDADSAIDDARDEISEADDDGDDVNWADDTFDEAKDLYDEAEEAFDDEDWDEAVELAEEAEEMADEAVDRIDEKESGDENDAEDAINEADEAIDDAKDAIEEAEDDGDDVDDAEDLLEEAKDLYDEADEAFDDEDWKEAIEKAEEAKEAAEDAEDEL